MPDRSWRKGFAALAMGIGLVFAVPALAQDDDEDDSGEAAAASDSSQEEDEEAGLYSQNGFYLIGTATHAFIYNRGDISDSARRRRPGSSVEVDNTWGYGGRAGYRLHPHAAVEGHFEFLNRIDIDVRNPSGKFEDEIQAFSVTGNVKGYLSTGRFQPFAVLGAGWMRQELDPAGASSRRNNGFTARFGGGIDIYGSPDVALTLESSYVLATGGTSDLDHFALTGGLMLRFYPLD